MINYSHILSEEELNLLRACIGKRLDYVEGAPLWKDPYKENWSVWNTVRLHFDSEAIDLNVFEEVIEINEEGDKEEIGKMNVKPAPQDQLFVEALNEQGKQMPINRIVRRVGLLNNEGKILYEEAEYSSRAYTQAIVLEFEDDQILAFDTASSFTEMITVKIGNKLDGLLYCHADEYDFTDEDWEAIPQEGVFESTLKFI